MEQMITDRVNTNKVIYLDNCLIYETDNLNYIIDLIKESKNGRKRSKK